LPSTTNGTRQNLTMRIDVSDSIRMKPAILSYISGISLSSKASTQNIASIQRQISSTPSFSWNTNRLRLLNQSLISLTSMNFEITSNSIFRNNSGSFLTTIVSFSDSIVIKSISISYLIFN
jgi:hypothetical protein